MQLILTVEKAPQEDFVGTCWRCGPEGGTLGRGSDCDLVLPDPQRYTSSLQAVIEGHRDGFRIVDHSTNGTYHNAPQTLIGRSRSVALEDGDRLYLGDFVLRVGIEVTDAGTNRASAQPDPADAPAEDSDASAAGEGGAAAVADDWNIGEFSLPWEGSDTAPDKEQQSVARTDDEAGYSQSPEREYFSPPAPSAGRSEAIPDDWDDFLTGFHDLGAAPGGPAEAESTDDLADDPGDNRPEVRPDGRAESIAEPAISSDAAPGQVAPAAFEPDDDELSTDAEQQRSAPLGEEPAAAAAQTPPAEPEPEPEPIPKPSADEAPPASPEAAPAPPASVPHAGPSVAEAPARPQPSQPSQPPQPSSAQQAAGPDDRARDEILRLVTEGLMALLRGRAEIKNEFRIEQTRIVQRENNPLKFSPNVDEALKRVLGHSDAGGFLTGPQAYQDALEDLQAHQLAILSAVQRAIESVIGQFDPEQLEARLKRISPLSARTPVLRAAKCWNLFTLHYEEVAGKMREDARQLFMAEFGAAYEDACRKIVASRDPQSRSD